MEFKKKGLAWAENIFDNVNMEVLGLDSFRERACKFYGEVNDFLDKPVPDLSLKLNFLDVVSKKSKVGPSQSPPKEMLLNLLSKRSEQSVTSENDFNLEHNFLDVVSKKSKKCPTQSPPEEVSLNLILPRSEQSMPSKNVMIPASSPYAYKNEKLGKSCNIYDEAPAKSPPREVLHNLLSQRMEQSMPSENDLFPASSSSVYSDLKLGKSCNIYDEGSTPKPNSLPNIASQDVYLEACDLLEKESNQTLIGGVVHNGKCTKLDNGVPADSLPDMLDMTYCGNDHPSMSNYEIEESELTCSGNGASEAPTEEQRGQMGASGNDHCKDGEHKTLPEIGSSELQEQGDQMGSYGNDHWQDSETDMLPEIGSSESQEHRDQMGTSGNDHWRDGEPNTFPEIESFELQEQCDQLESSGNDHWPDSETDIDTLPEIEIAEEYSAGNKPSLHPGSLDYFVCLEEDIDLVDLNSEPLLEEFETVKLGKYGPTEEDGKSRLTAHANMTLSYKQKIKDALKMGFMKKKELNQINNVCTEAATSWIHREPKNLTNSGFIDESEWVVL
ncbi:hypothetical protein QJS10_CPA01g02128 [Acorus calamus]|uniref:Uncharacterized protein n=1 Tax=Acorus calamus TaxID=4465 RepID=A0AAV9FLC0_ACOCL|nr:hypothetical protein QJS10_CPA01g02128 [Acorus calamus]